MDYASEKYRREFLEMRQRDIDKHGLDVYTEYLREIEGYERDVINTRNAVASLYQEGSPTTVKPLPTLDEFAKRKKN